jgi:hypothetical protein
LVSPGTGERGEREQALVGALIDVALANPGVLHLPSLDLVAREYGATPRRKPIDPQELSEELGLLRDAIWRCVQECYPNDRGGLVFVGRLDRYRNDATLKATVSSDVLFAHSTALGADVYAKY